MEWCYKKVQILFKSLFLSLTVLLGTERVLLVFLIVWACRAPELPVCASVRGAGVVGLSHEDEREHARLTVGVATVRLVPGLCRINERKGREDGNYRRVKEIWLWWYESGALKLISRQRKTIFFFPPSCTHPTPDSWLRCPDRYRASACCPGSWASAVRRSRWLQSLCGTSPRLASRAAAECGWGPARRRLWL